MNRKKLTIRADEGLNTGFAELLAQVAGRFDCGVWIEHASKRVNAKSIMGVLSLRLRSGESFVVVASGDDEAGAVEAVARLIEKGEA